MKKQFFTLLLNIVLSSSIVLAAPIFQEPLIQKTYTEALSRLDAKTSNIILNENAKNLLTKKQEAIGQILLVADTAWQKKNKKELIAQVKLFRLAYSDAVKFLEEQSSTNKPSPKPDVNPSKKDSEAIGIPMDITYYADSFE